MKYSVFQFFVSFPYSLYKLEFQDLFSFVKSIFNALKPKNAPTTPYIIRFISSFRNGKYAGGFMAQ